MRGCLRGKGPDHLRSGHLLAQSCEGVSGKTAGPPQDRAYLSPELQGCLRRYWPHDLKSQHVGAQSCEDVSCESLRSHRRAQPAAQHGRTGPQSAQLFAELSEPYPKPPLARASRVLVGVRLRSSSGRPWLEVLWRVSLETSSRFSVPRCGSRGARARFD